jgi:hypothetical protein
MPITDFDRDSWAKWYAEQHLKTDPGVGSVFYLPANSGQREIRFVEVNVLMGNRNDNELEPIEFGVDAGSETEHRLFILDVTPDQWNRIQEHKLDLPDGWTLEDAIAFTA